MSLNQYCSNVPQFPVGEPGFLQELKSYERRKVHWQICDEAPENMLLLSGSWKINRCFPDSEQLLETAYDALNRFAAENVPQGNGEVEITSLLDENLAAEEYTITVSPEGIFLRASDTEGIRRAVYSFIDMCRGADIPALAYQSIKRKPWLKNRISRCFFGPIKRPPFFRDELTDNIDYYPEAYLDRLASEGVNGIWLTVVWKEVSETSFFPVDPLRTKRIEKLKCTVEKCRRYGIKVWVFCIEPASWNENHKPPFEDMRGKSSSGTVKNAFCVAAENSQKYIRDSVYSIFRDTPNLGGMMLISLGERPTSCLSFLSYTDNENNPCAGICGLSKSQVLNKVLSSIQQGIADAGSSAQVLSWLYNPRAGQIQEWWFTLPEELNSSQILAFNFESGCSKMQDGRVNCGGDYWLSCIGPSDRFGRIAAAAKDHCQLAAKIQVGCSHELATVPFMPVPGNLYEKYKAMKRLGVSSVIQCWYFGNYPGIMNRAAGMLAFEEFKDSQQEFLYRLALPDWGKNHASQVSKMWHDFGKAYSNYPLDIQFQYYGPMHDGVVWPLHLKQVMRPLPRSWKPDAAPAGDAIGECLNSFDLSSAVTLTRTLALMWSKAVSNVSQLRRDFANAPERLRDCDLYEALDLLFNSGARIMAFYDLRRKLFDAPVGFRAILLEMQKIVDAEKAASAKMIELCRSDARLGYHSEAEVFKFYPEKLAWRIGELEKLKFLFDKLLQSSENEAKALLKWEGQTFKTGVQYDAETFSFEANIKDLELEISICNKPLPPGAEREQQFVLLMDSQGVKFPLEFGVHETGTPWGYNEKCLGVTVEHLSGNRRLARVPLNKIGYAATIFIGVMRTWFDAENKQHFDIIPDGEYIYEPRLNFNGSFSADKLGELIL